DGTLTVTMNVTDVAGNTGNVTDTTVLDTDDVIEITPANALNLEEAGLTSAPTVTDAGSVFITANDGLLNVTISFNNVPVTVWANGTANTPIIINGTYGKLTVTSYDQATGKLSYQYELSAAQNHSAATNDTLTDSFIVKATDIDGDQAQTTIKANIVDDKPTASPDTNSVNIEVASFKFSNLSANWENTFNGGQGIERYDSDKVTGLDQVRWGGSGDSRDQKSGYGFITDSSGLSNSLNLNQDIKLGQFTHYNRPIPSGSAIGDGNNSTTDATLTLSFTINGVVISFQIQVSHNETPNNGANPNDIITILNPIQVIEIDGTKYTVNILGFYPSGSAPIGDPTRVIETIEGQNSSFELYARIVPGSSYQLPKTTGNILNGTDSNGVADKFGADKGKLFDVTSETSTTATAFGSSDSITIQGQYGTLVLNKDGSYTYTLTAGTDEIPSGADDIFTYTLKDSDDDIAQSTLTIKINEVNAQGQTVNSPIQGKKLVLDATNESNNEDDKDTHLLVHPNGVTSSDIYQWQSGDSGTDHIASFDLQSDKLVLSDLLKGEYKDNLENYFQFSLDGDSTVISIDGDQDGNYEQEIVLDGVDLFKEYGLSEQDIINGLIGRDGNGPLILESESDTAIGASGYFDNSTPLQDEKLAMIP
ncbi:MAG: choice-of-anchor K domain-containing protein, partial [Shewanella sp.]